MFFTISSIIVILSARAVSTRSTIACSWSDLHIALPCPKPFSHCPTPYATFMIPPRGHQWHDAARLIVMSDKHRIRSACTRQIHVIERLDWIHSHLATSVVIHVVCSASHTISTPIPIGLMRAIVHPHFVGAWCDRFTHYTYPHNSTLVFAAGLLSTRLAVVVSWALAIYSSTLPMNKFGQLFLVLSDIIRHAPTI